MSEILFFLTFRVNFTDAPISDIHTCVKVYTSCQYGAFFTKCTIVSKLFAYPPHYFKFLSF